MADRAELLALASQIVSAHFANNRVATEDVPDLITAVYQALSNLGCVAETSVAAEPAVPVKRSVMAGHLVCLECGKHFSMLKRHLATDHQLTPEQYRQKWELPASYPVVAPNYAKIRSALAKEVGLGKAKGRSPGAKGLKRT
jgi:predicted transcriptional regulator